jgi:cyclopropane fatty-acyl-phospholipid synthase-like methyltransferase
MLDKGSPRRLSGRSRKAAPAIERADLIVTDIEILRLHYADTLKAWRERFVARRDDAKALLR